MKVTSKLLAVLIYNKAQCIAFADDVVLLTRSKGELGKVNKYMEMRVEVTEGNKKSNLGQNCTALKSQNLSFCRERSCLRVLDLHSYSAHWFSFWAGHSKRCILLSASWSGKTSLLAKKEMCLSKGYSSPRQCLVTHNYLATQLVTDITTFAFWWQLKSFHSSIGKMYY